MNVRRGLFRVWLVASILWAAFATWSFWNSCVPGPDGWLWCATGQDDWIMEMRYFKLTDAMRLAAWLLGAPLAAFIAGAAGLWVTAGFSRAKS
jgi:hypothetical protein